MTSLAPLRRRFAPAQLGTLLPMRPFLFTVFSVDAMTMLVIVAYGSSYLINVVHAPPSYPAYALGIFGFMKLLSAPIGGRLLDRLRPRSVVAIALTLNLTGLGIMIGWHAARGYLVGVAFLSAGIGVTWLVMFHVLGIATAPAVRARITSYMSLVSAAATASGFAAGGIIALTDYWPLAFGVGASCATAIGFLLRHVVDVVARTAETGSLPHVEETPDPSPPRPVRPRLRVIAGGSGLMHSAALGGVGGIFGPFVLHTLNLQLLAGSLMLLPAIAIGGATMWLAGRNSRSGRRLQEMALLYTVGALGLLALAFVSTWYLFVVVALTLGISIGGATPIMGATMLDVSYGGQRKASVLGWLFFAQGIGTVSGPFLVGLVISLLGVREAVAFLGVFEGIFVGILLASHSIEHL